MRAVEARWWSSRVQALQAGGMGRVVGFAVQGGGGRGAYDAPFINLTLISSPQFHRSQIKHTLHTKHATQPQCHHAQPHPTRSSSLCIGLPQPQHRWTAWMAEKQVKQKVGGGVGGMWGKRERSLWWMEGVVRGKV